MAFKPLSCVFGNFWIPQRYVVVIMMHLCLVNAYHLRVVLNIAMTEILEHKNRTHTVNACPMYNYTEVENIEGGKYDWPSNVEALILYAFYIGYLLSHVPGGWLADVFGARHVLGACMVLSIVITFAYPTAIRYGGHWGAVALRIILGVVQGPLYPAISTMMQCWVPKRERAFLGGISYGGSNLGTITGNILTGLMIDMTRSWTTPFYVWAVVAFVWYCFYLLMVFSTPADHPFITAEEKDFLDKNLQKRAEVSVPWGKIFRSRVLYVLMAAQFGHDYLILSLVTDLSKYLNNILKLDIKSNAMFTAVPFFFIWASSILTGLLADWLVNNGHISALLSRKLWTAVSSVGSGLVLVVTVYIGCSRTWAIVLYTVALAVHGPFYSGMKVNVNDITQHFGGALMAVVNGVGALGGVLGPLIVGVLTPTYALHEWQLVFWILLAIQVVTTVIYWTLTTVERESWDYIEEE